jgi:hypothetical protein
MPSPMSDLRQGLAEALRTIPSLRVYELLPDNPNPPGVAISLDRVVYDSVFARGCDEYEFTVHLFVARGDDRSAQVRIEDYVAGSGPSSIKAAIENDPTLGGVAQTVRVSEARNIGTQDRADGTSLMIVDFTVTIHS